MDCSLRFGRRTLYERLAGLVGQYCVMQAHGQIKYAIDRTVLLAFVD